MNKALLKSEYVSKQLSITISNANLQNLLWACLKTGANLPSIWMMNKEYDRKQSSGFMTHYIVSIHPSQIETFESLVGAILFEAQKVKLN